jgi:endoglucanase
MCGMVAGIAFAQARPSLVRSRSPQAHIAYAQQCSDSQYPAKRNPTNPLDLRVAPGADPLHGAHFFVDGPRHGDAAAGIEQLLGINPQIFPDNYSWGRFMRYLAAPQYAALLSANPTLARQVHLLELIGSEQETQSVSEWAMGGGPGAIYDQVQKLLCDNLTADHTPHTVPVFTTDFIWPDGHYCPSVAMIEANEPTFYRQINELAMGTGRHPVVYLLEIDSVGVSTCLSPAARVLWQQELRYEIQRISAQPHTVVYLEGGASDESSARYVARMIDGVCVVGDPGAWRFACGGLRGIWVNGTHFMWSSVEIQWAAGVVQRIARLVWSQTHVKFLLHYIVNTAQNGRGPLRNPHPYYQGAEDLCNPPGRGLGRIPTANTAPTFDGLTFPLLDAFLWTGAPGRSHGSSCQPGDAPPGVWFSRFAIELASNASQQLGPKFPNEPYSLAALSRVRHRA